MVDPFWMDLESAFNVVSSNSELQVEVKRGDKQAIVKYLPEVDGGCMFIKVKAVSEAVPAVELNPAAKKEA